MATYNSQFGIRFVVYPPFANAQHELLTDLKKLLNIQESKASKAPQLEKNLKSELGNYFGILFEPSYRFDTFVAGANNQFAFSAAKAVLQERHIIRSFSMGMLDWERRILCKR